MRIQDLEREDRYHRERYALYRAKVYGPRPTSPARLRALKLASEAAERRLQHAREQANPDAKAARSAYGGTRRGGDASRTAAPPDGGLRHHQAPAARLTSSLADNPERQAEARPAPPLPPRPL